MGLGIEAFKSAALIEAIDDKARRELELATGKDHPRLDDPTARYLCPPTNRDGTEYRPERRDGLAVGFYRVSTDEADKLHFHVGPYSYYNRWRAALAAMVNEDAENLWAHPKPCPFYELIDFSDSTGFIGPATSAKLARDFAAWQHLADGYEPERGFRDLYAQFRSAFELAAGEGVVVFT